MDIVENIRIAIRDALDDFNIGFFDNNAGIKYSIADLTRFLTGSCSVLTIKYFSKDIDTIRSGCKLSFLYKEKAFWLTVMDFKKVGFEVELTAYSLSLEANSEERGAYAPSEAKTFKQYLEYYDPEHSFTLGINEVSDKSIKLEWTGTATVLSRLYSVATSFDAELEFVTELNDDYSLKQHTLNVYRKGNVGQDRTGSPIRVGKELEVINYSDNIKALRTVVRARGKDGLSLVGFNRKEYDENGNVLFSTDVDLVRAPQARDQFPSVGKNSADNYALLDLGDTEYSTQEALYGYMLAELKKRCVPEITYETTGNLPGDVGDTLTLIDDIHFSPELYVQARISEQTDSLITGKSSNTVLTNFERKYSQISDSILKRVEELAEQAKEMNTAIGSKADQTAVDDLSTVVDGKVSTSDVTFEENGLVTQADKTVTGETIADMIVTDPTAPQKIGDEITVKQDMIETGAVTQEKIQVDDLSEVSKNLGDVETGSITNPFVTPYSHGTIKLSDKLMIDTTFTSPTVADKAIQNVEVGSNGVVLTAKTSEGVLNYSMTFGPELLEFQKINYDTSLGGTGKWNLYYSGVYSILNVDIVNQKVRLQREIGLPYGVTAVAVRIGNLVTLSVNRQVKNINTVVENGLAAETIPVGFRPISQAHLTLTGNVSTTINATSIIHLNPDGSIRFTNTSTGNRVWSGTVTYTTIDEFPTGQ